MRIEKFLIHTRNSATCNSNSTTSSSSSSNSTKTRGSSKGPYDT